MTMIRYCFAAILLAGWTQPAAAHAEIEMQLADVTQEIEIRPDDPALYLQRGELRRHLEDWFGAEADFARAHHLGTDEIREELDLYRGRLYQEAGQSRSAIAALDRYLSRRPNHVGALRIRALAFAQMNLLEASVADYTQLISVDAGRSPELWLERARLWVRLENFDAALASIDDAILEFGPLVTLIEFGVDTEVGRNKHSAALDRLEDLPPALAGSPNWLWRRGTLLEQLNRLDEAAVAYAEARDAILHMPERRQQTPAMRGLLARLSVR